MLNELLRHIKSERLEAERGSAASRIAQLGVSIRAARKMRKVAPAEDLSAPMSRAATLKELNAILATRATSHGFVVTLPEYLFDNHGLRSTALDKLARMARFLLAHPGIRVTAEVSENGDAQHDEVISCKRMFDVLEYFVTHGVFNLYIPARGSVELDLQTHAIDNRRQTRLELVGKGKAGAKAREAAAA